MKRIAFDIETNGLLDTMDKIHCICMIDLDTYEEHSYGPEQIDEAVTLLRNAEYIVGHNIINFDLPAIKIVYPMFEPLGTIRDTLVMSRLVKANLVADDAMEQKTGLSKRLWGSHSLKAWGLRTGLHKGDFDGGDWQTYSPEMLEYCLQDVRVTVHILTFFVRYGFSDESFELEHELAHVALAIGNNGWTFNMEKATDLYAKLAKRRSTLEDELQTLFEPWEEYEEFIPKANNKTRGYVKGEPFTKVKVVHFNPNSRAHIARCLIEKYGWKPKVYSSLGAVTIDETILSALHYPEAQKLAEYFMLAKRLGQLAEGKQAWMKVQKNGIIKHTIISGGTISGRASHRGPNMAQVPRASAPYGKECRDLFSAPKGWMMCGSDLSGIELRLLAHYLDDGGKYAKQVLEGDIHTYNQKAAGLESRDQAKTFIYSTIYGGGDKRVGEIAGGNAKDGKRLKTQFERSVPAFKRLKNELNNAAQR
ncbi:MAG: hypothetical protein CMI60_14165, partial [Parvibaculum sp.]|nr:hypothetical protein [Parvibaculum sp.]